MMEFGKISGGVTAIIGVFALLIWWINGSASDSLFSAIKWACNECSPEMCNTLIGSCAHVPGMLWLFLFGIAFILLGASKFVEE